MSRSHVGCRSFEVARRVLLAAGAMAMVGSGVAGGCARPNEVGWTPVYTNRERGNLILRNWDLEGKMMQDDIDHALLLRPHSELTQWHIR